LKCDREYSNKKDPDERRNSSGEGKEGNDYYHPFKYIISRSLRPNENFSSPRELSYTHPSNPVADAGKPHFRVVVEKLDIDPGRINLFWKPSAGSMLIGRHYPLSQKMLTVVLAKIPPAMPPWAFQRHLKALYPSLLAMFAVSESLCRAFSSSFSALCKFA